MRILKISDVYFPRINGVSTSIRTFAHELQRQGHEVTLIAPQYPSELEESFEILRIPSRYLFLDPEDRLLKRRALRSQIEQLRQRRYDIIHVHTPFAAHYEGAWLARQLQLPLVESYHTYFEEYLDKYLRWMPRKLLRYSARHFSRSQCAQADTLVVPSQPMLDVLRGYGIDTPAEVIPTGIPSGIFSHGDGHRFRLRFSITEDRRLMLYVGRVAHEKNIDFLIRVVDRIRQSHPEVLLLITGEGPAENHLRQLCYRLGLGDHVQFIGYLARERDLPDCYAAGDLFAFASATETQGLVLLESMQAGTPVVTTAVMGTAEVMADRRGGLVAPENVEQFSAAVCRLLEDPDLHADLSRQAVAKAAEWSVLETTQRLTQCYRQCIGAMAGEHPQLRTQAR
jgi:glycosyltransferase involved in cell wall biosynthesis